MIKNFMITIDGSGPFIIVDPHNPDMTSIDGAVRKATETIKFSFSVGDNVRIIDIDVKTGSVSVHDAR